MSYKALSWAAKQELKCHEKMVLMMLANRADPESHSCFPSMGTLSKDCGMSMVQARRAVAALEKAGLLTRSAQVRSYGQTANLFTLELGGTPDLIDRPPDLLDRHKQLSLNSRSITARVRARRMSL